MVRLNRLQHLDPSTRRFLFFVLLAVVPLAIVTTIFLLPVTRDLSAIAGDAGQLTATGVACFSCVRVATQPVGRARRAWAMFAVAAASGVAAGVFEVGFHALNRNELPFPSLLDLFVLGTFPFAIAGLLAFPTARVRASRLRVALDFAMFAFSVMFIVGAVSPALAARTANLSSVFEVAVALAYPLFDVLLLTAAFVTLRRSVATHRTRIVFLLVGFAISALAVTVPPLLSAIGRHPSNDLAQLGTAYGFAFVALAPWVPKQMRAKPELESAWWQQILPFAGLVAVGLTTVFSWFTNGQLPTWEGVPGIGLLGVLLAGQLLANSESNDLLRQTRSAEQTARVREAMLQQIVEHAPQGVAAISVDRRILNANPRLSSILYAPVEALNGATLDSFVNPDYAERVLGGFGEEAPEDDTYVSDCRARRADGTEFWLHWSVTPIRRADGAIDYFMAMFDDVTARREAEETAVANLAQLEQLNRLKSEFVSVVSHEFRTGLVGIQGFSELIRDQEMEIREVRILADEINNDAQRLSRLITDMLDFDRLEAGKIKLDLKPLDLNELAGDAVERARVATNKHTWRVDLQPNVPVVLGDTDRLMQVMANLLTNAIKYSPDGGEIVVSTRTVSSGVEMSVKDHGRGIPPEFISRLFGRYERYEDKHAGKIIGTGLGLAIARQIVEMHGGRIAVDSTLGEGSEFRVVIPAAAGRPTAALDSVDLSPAQTERDGRSGSLGLRPNLRASRDA